MMYGAMHAETLQEKSHKIHYHHFLGGFLDNLLRLFFSLSVSDVSSFREPRLELLILKASSLIRERSSRRFGLLFELRRVNVSSLIKDRSSRGGR